MKRFSILIPIIKVRFLGTAIQSVVHQTYHDWELVLLNDCSKENVDAVVKNFADQRIRYYKSEVNLGKVFPTVAWNKAVSLSKGEYICLLGDDDFLSANYLEEISKLVEKYPAVNLFRARLKRVNEMNQVIQVGDKVPVHETWDQMLYQRNVNLRVQSTSEFTVKRDKLVEVGGFPHFPRACGSDDVLYLMLAEENGVAATNAACSYWRKSSLNISDNDNHSLNAHKERFYLRWERNFLDSMFSNRVPISALYQSIENKLSRTEQPTTEAMKKNRSIIKKKKYLSSIEKKAIILSQKP